VEGARRASGETAGGCAGAVFGQLECGVLSADINATKPRGIGDGSHIKH
jgi:hypothetical protein